MDGKKFNKLAKVSKSRKMGKIMVDEDVMGQDPLKGYPFQKKFSVEQSFRNMVETSNLNLSEDDGEGGRTDGLDKSPSEMTPKQRKAKADHDKALRDRDARKKARVAQMRKNQAHADTPAEKERKKKERERNLKAFGAKGGETARERAVRLGHSQSESNEFNTYRNMIDMWEENLQEEMITYRVKGMQRPEEEKFKKSAKMMGLKITMDKGSKDTVIVMSGTKKKLRDFDAVARGKSSFGDPSTITHFDEEIVSEGKKIQDIVRKHKRELQKAQKSGNLELSKKAEDELSNWASSSGEIRGDDEDEFIDWLDSNLDDLVKGKIKEEVIHEEVPESLKNQIKQAQANLERARKFKSQGYQRGDGREAQKRNQKKVWDAEDKLEALRDKAEGLRENADMVIHVDDKLQTNLVTKYATKFGLKSKKTKISWSGKDGVVVSGDANKLKKFMSSVEKVFNEETELTENYRKLAKHGMGTETPKSIKVGTEIDYYQKDGAKYMGKVTKMSRQSYTVKDDKTKKDQEFFYHDRIKAAKLLKQGDNVQEDKRYAFISTILEKAYDENDVKKVQQLEKKLQGMLKEVDKTMRGSGLSAPAFNNVRSGIQKGLESIQKFYKIARK